MTLTVHRELVWGACVRTSLIGGDTLIYLIIQNSHWRKEQCVVFNIDGCIFENGIVVEGYVPHFPVDHIIGSSDFTGESEVFKVYWNCVASDHHWLCKKKKGKSVFDQ